MQRLTRAHTYTTEPSGNSKKKWSPTAILRKQRQQAARRVAARKTAAAQKAARELRAEKRYWARVKSSFIYLTRSDFFYAFRCVSLLDTRVRKRQASCCGGGGRCHTHIVFH